MQAIVSELDEPHREMALDIWGGLKAVTGLKQLAGAARPHFTYQTAARYDATVAAATLGRIAAATPAFAVETGAAAVLRGTKHVLYLPVLVNDALARLHDTLWSEIAPVAADRRSAHAPGSWAPHVTLAAGRIEEAQMPGVLRFLAGRDARWSVTITNVCLVPDTSTSEGWLRFPLQEARQ
jgi:2'-5' RNA ligase